MAKLKPVFPEVVSTMVLPGLINPLISAFSMMDNAIRSLEDCPGLNHSNLA